MTSDELLQKIKNKTANTFIFVGPNGSGKSYMLNEIYSKVENLILIDEEGFVKASDNRKTLIVEDYFVYENTYNRGVNHYEQESEKFNEDSINLVKILKELKNKIPTKNQSAGIKKIDSVITNLLSRNLNNVKYFLFDEPDNYLDDEHLKFLKGVFDGLSNNNKTICFATHNPRLLEIMNIDIDNIYLFNKWINDDIINVSTSELKQSYIECCQNIEKLNNFNNAEKSIKMHYWHNNNLLDVNLYNIIHNYDFYKTLFYDKVVLAEGLTEKLLLKESNNFKLYINNFYFCNGKVRFPIMISIFNKLKKTIFLVYDDDNDKNQKNSFSVELNTLFSSYKSVVFSPNLEEELIITQDIIKEILENNANSSDNIDKFKKNFKATILPYAIRKDKDLLKKIEDKVLYINTNVYEQIQ